MAIKKFEISEGDVFGLLTATERVQRYFPSGKKNGWGWMATCVCGSVVGPKTPADLVHGKVASCGPCGYTIRGKGHRKSGTHNPSMEVFRNYKNRARERNLEFSLDSKEFFKLLLGPCVYCGQSNSSYFKARQEWEETFLYTGIDRIDSSMGYVSGNVQSCCKVCNRAKSDLTEQEFLNWAKRVAAHE